MMKERLLRSMYAEFRTESPFVAVRELASGHINDTYLIETEAAPYYVLQRINHNVFLDVPGLVRNKVLVSKHLSEKLRAKGETDVSRRCISFVATHSGNYYHRDEEGNYWNMMVYIADSVTHETVSEEEIAFEGGKLLGEFLNLTSDFDAGELIDVIPNFHDMSFRFSQFYDALKGADTARKAAAEKEIAFVLDLKEEMHIIQRLKESGDIPVRVTHNDTKISNTLFDKQNKGLCIIDTDTVMPGIVHYDFGDAIRTICNTAAEDEKDLDKVTFNFPYYKAYVKGFLESMSDAMSPVEIEHLPLGAKTMVFIIGLRFLTDYLNGDVYYKIKYPDHNIDRARNQFKLVASMSEYMEQMKSELIINT